MGAGLGILGTVFIALAACGGIIGAVLLWLGLRGKRINEHPICRKCGFDLVGAGGPALCPECGASLTTKRSIRPGEKRTRAGLVSAGCVLLLVGVASAGATVWIRASSFNWNTVKPFVVLKQDARSSSPTTMSGAAAELQFRIQNGTLDPARIAEVVRTGLELQGNPDGPWTPEWGDLLESAGISGHLTHEQLITFLRQGIKASPLLRRKVIAGDVIPFGIRVGAPRTGTSPAQAMRIACTAVEIDGQRVGPSAKVEANTTVNRNGLTQVLSSVSCELSAGVHSVRIICTVEALGSVQGRNSPVAAWEVVLEDSLEVFPRGTELFTWERNPSHAPKMSGAVRVLRLELSGAHDRPSLEFAIGFDGHPVAVASELIVIAGDREIPLGTLTAAPGSGMSSGGGVDLDSPLEAEKVDVVLRPSPKAMKESLEIDRAWGEEIVIRDVPITRANN